MPDHWIRNIMSGAARGAGASLLRGVLSVAEPVYKGAVAINNRLFDRSIRAVHRLPRPVVCVGNLTTGGTGKTPTVVWLVRQLQTKLNLRVAVLLRGYKADPEAEGSDEELLLRDALPGALVLANPDRFGAASRALAKGETIDAFVLDDGFQHRKLHRDFDLVLIDATNPFGYGHVLPRGMLRESPAGLARAHAVLITRADLVDDAAIAEIESVIRRANPNLPVFHAGHRLGPISIDGTTQPLDALRGRRVFLFAGIGNPAAFEQSLVASAGVAVVGRRWFADHHAYAQEDVESLALHARSANAEFVVTTTKDRMKLQQLVDPDAQIAGGANAKLVYVDMSVAFRGEEESRLFEQVAGVIRPSL